MLPIHQPFSLYILIFLNCYTLLPILAFIQIALYPATFSLNFDFPAPGDLYHDCVS